MGVLFTYNGLTFDDTNIISGEIIRTKSPINADLSYDTFDIKIKDDNGDGIYLQDSEGNSLADVFGTLLQGQGEGTLINFSNFVRGTVGRLTKDGEFIGEFYINSVDRVSKYEWNLHFISALGMLDTIPHKGGVYITTVSPAFTPTAGYIIKEILGGTKTSEAGGYETYTGGIFTYQLQTTFASTPVSGWLPYSSSSRDNLQQVLFATGGSLVKDGNGVKIQFWQPLNSTEITNDRLYIDDRSVEYQSKPTKVVVTEHSYLQTALDTEVTLYSTVSGSANQLVIFDSPCYDLKWNGSAFSGDCGANYAVVNGIGTLTGKQYTHNTATVVKVTGQTGTENTFSVTDAYLVSSLNSLNVAERVASYYVDAQIVNYGMTIEGDVSVGDRIRFTDPFGDQVEGYITSEDINISSVMKSSSKIATNWQPNHIGNTFNHYTILRNQGDFFHPTDETLSKESTAARIYVFGGFQGGSGSWAGEDGEDAEERGTTIEDEQGAGGAGGEGGEGGYKVKMNYVDINLTDRNYTLTQVGAGGAGGSKQVGDTEPTEGLLGGETICDGISSDSGEHASVLTTGFANPLTGDIYGAKAVDGITGGDGANGYADADSVEYLGVSYTGGRKGAYAEGYEQRQVYAWLRSWAYGGGGGGATGLSNGSNGANGVAYYNNNPYAFGGNGGTGATQQAFTQASFGLCGAGACGGGGGGGGGTCWAYGVTGHEEYGRGGAGGQGQNGQQGSNGFALILYN